MSVAKFRPVYERHVGYVVVGDVASALADMVQENIPAVFHGVDTPHGAVAAYEIKNVRAEGDRMIGETVYDTGERVIGLRSIWEERDGRWLAAGLENFTVDDSQVTLGAPGKTTGSTTVA